MKSENSKLYTFFGEGNVKFIFISSAWLRFPDCSPKPSNLRKVASSKDYYKCQKKVIDYQYLKLTCLILLLGLYL